MNIFETYKKQIEECLDSTDPRSFVLDVAFDAYAKYHFSLITEEEYNIINALAKAKGREILLQTGLEVEYCGCGCGTTFLKNETDYETFDWKTFDRNLRKEKVINTIGFCSTYGIIRGTQAFYWENDKGLSSFFINEDGDSYFTIASSKTNSEILPFNQALNEFKALLTA